MSVEQLLIQHRVAFKRQGEHHHARSGWIQLCCPMCDGGGTKFHLGVNLRHLYANCWKCGPKNLARVIAQVTRQEVSHIRSVLDGIKPEKLDDAFERRGSLSLPPVVKGLQEPHFKYLKQRGFDVDELIKLWKIEGIGISSRLNWRIFIPVFFHGRVVSWTTRSISNSVEARYISASPNEEEINHKNLLYGIDYCRHACVIVEGPTDVWRIGPGAVATFGTSYSRAQIAQMSRFPYRSICFDNEPEAQERASRLADELAVFPGETNIVSLDADDPGSASDYEVNQIRQHCLGV